MTTLESKISVIIPAYNVEPYVKECLESVVKQTFKDFEALIVLGNSSDDTETVCKEFIDKDNRFRLVYQLDKGLGSARNLGIKKAKTDLIAFLDADDYWDSTMLEKLYAKMQEKNYDLVICDRYNVYYDCAGNYAHKEWLHERAMEYYAESVQENKNLICDIEVSVNGKLYKKNLFVNYSIRQPNCFGEDRAIMHYLIAKCKSIGKVPEPLYFYRVGRQGNSVCNALVYRSTAECMEFIYQSFKKDGIDELYRNQLRHVFMKISNIGRIGLRYGQLDENEEYKKYEKEIESTIDKYFPELNGRCYLIGSYNLWRLAREAFYKLKKEDKNKVYSYSSLISMFARTTNDIPARENRNKDHKNWLINDLRKSFIRQFNLGSCDLLLLDFLEERYPVIEYRGSYYTGSNLFFQNTDIPLERARVLSEDERTSLWEEACKKLIELISRCMDVSKVVLIKNKLSTRYMRNNELKVFETLPEIEYINDRLEKYYDFFIANAPSVNVVDFSNDVIGYTDYDFPHGCHPWNLNERFYKNNETALVDLIYG